MPTLRIADINENEPHFITLTVIEWINIFTKKRYFDSIINSLKFCQNKKGLQIYEFVLMTNHLHMIIQVKKPNNLSSVIRDFKQFTTNEIMRLLENDNRKHILSLLNKSFYKKAGTIKQIWQRDNYPEVIQTEKFYNNKVEYIHHNPVKAGYVEKPEDWLYSSARNMYLNDDSILAVDRFH